jgi:hypothetical protein
MMAKQQRHTHLARATYRTRHSIKRKAAGEHSIPVDDLVRMYAQEWALPIVDTALLQLEANRLERSIAARNRRKKQVRKP